MTPEALPVQVEKQPEKPYSYWGEVGRRLWHSRSARIGLTIIAIELFIAIIGPLLAPYDPLVSVPDNRKRTPPCIHLLGCPADQPRHLFGLDSNGRDLFSRAVRATRVSLFIGVKYFFLAFPEASIEFRVTREGSRPMAASFLQRMKLDTAGYRHPVATAGLSGHADARMKGHRCLGSKITR